MSRSVDHLVIAARDLDAQAAFYRRLGFQVGARNRHPWGTENHIVQFDGAFLELIGLGEGFVAPEEATGVFSFAGFIARFLVRHEGVAMLVGRSADAEADRAAFARDDLGDFTRFDFARKGRRPDGQEVDVAFSLAFAAARGLPEAGFFVSQQHFPQNFWNARMQVHPNGALGVAGVVIAEARPEEASDFLRRFLGASEARQVDGGYAIDAGDAVVEILTPLALTDRYGARAIEPDGPPLAAMRVNVANLPTTRALLSANAIDFSEPGGALFVAPRLAMGAAILFESGSARGS